MCMSKESRSMTRNDGPTSDENVGRPPEGWRVGSGAAQRSTRMLSEARDAPAAVSRQLAQDDPTYSDFGALLRARTPSSILTVARGSSDHAAHYMAYLVMARLGRLVTSLPMSIVTLYHSRLDCEGLVAWGFSQSGQSPDLIAPTRQLRAGGARTVAVVNDAAS